jgi:NTP pyrophosphatase (non-canonical NTP hydrolase)
MSTKTLADMTAEIVANNQAKGWHDNPPAFPEAMAMLHSEVSEALEAWRQWGTDDVTDDPIRGLPHIMSDASRKPEGVGSEFADILIRLLDDGYLYGVDLEREAARGGRLAVPATFPASINTLHNLIARASMLWDDHPDSGYRRELGAVLVFLRQLCEEYGIDLHAEYERKAAYNRTRAHRHGGKRL